MIKAIILDYDGVIRHIDMEKAVVACQTKGYYFPELMDKVWNNNFSKDLIKGKIDRVTWWKKLQNLHPDLENIDQNFIWDLVFAYPIIDNNVLAYVDELSKKYTTVILSNADEASKVKIKAEVGNTKFHHVFTSSDFGYIKPEREVYHKVVEKLGIQTHEAIFFDDKQNNVDGAFDVGIHAYLFKGIEKMKEQVNSHT